MSGVRGRVRTLSRRTPNIMRATLKSLAIGTALLGAVHVAAAEKNYGPGVTDTEIKLGQTAPYSGPASSFGATTRAIGNYFRMINASGGINGRKINLISLDDAYTPPKTVEQTRKLVDGDEVLAITGTLGTPGNLAIAKYLNGRKVPQLLAMSGSAKLNDPEKLPWTTTFYASQAIESGIYARYILQNKPTAKIAVLYQNDDYGKGYFDGFKAALGDKASLVIAEASYDITYPTIEFGTRKAREFRCRHDIFCFNPEVHGAGPSQGARDQLEPAEDRHYGIEPDRRDVEAGGPGGVDGSFDVALAEGPERSDLGG